MSEINLLKQNAGGGISNKAPKVLAAILFLVLLGAIGYYVFQVLELKSIDAEIISTEQVIVAEKQQALTMPNREELLARQSQVKALAELLGGHLYWSQILPAVAKVTLRSATYSNLKAGSSADFIAMDVTVPTLEDLDKYMQVFDLPQFNENFSDLRISGFNKVQNTEGSSIRFQVTMKYNPKIIQYQADSN